MHWYYTPYVLLLVITAIISAVLAVSVWRRRSTPGTVPFCLLMAAVAGWSLVYALELGSADLWAKVLWAKVEYLSIVIVPVAWLVFALQYTRRERWLTRRNLALLALEPLAILLLVWTNDSHGLIWKEIGLDTSGSFPILSLTYNFGFWAHAAFSYLTLLLSTLLIITELIHSSGLYYGQASALLVGTLAPWVGNALYISGLSPFPHLDLTPFSFTVTGLAFAWGLFRFHLLDLVPVAREAIIESMSDAILVLDLQNRIVDLNPAAQRLIGRTSQEAIGQQGTDVFPEAPELVEHYRDALQVHTSITLGKDESVRHYDLSISPVYAHGGQINGQLVVLRDITERKRAENELKQHREHLQELVDERTAALEKVNARLQEDIAERKRVEEALREGERFLASIFTSIQDGLSVLDKDLNIVRVNPQMEVWYSHNLPLVGRKCYEAYHDRNERCEICPSHRAIETGEATWDVAPTRGPGGAIVSWYEIYSFPFVDVTSGQMKGVIEYVRDITDRRRMEEERAQLVEELQEALTKIKTLRGLIPICASCKKIRNDQGYWEQIEVYVRDHSEAEFSHGICPDCARRLYPDFFTEGEDLR